MGLYAGNNNWVNDVYQFEQTDVVQGGPGGIDNVPLQHLADRTQWLKSQIGRINRIEDEVVITSSGPIANTLAGHLITAFANNVNIQLSLDDPHGFPHGALLFIDAFVTPNNVVSILGNGFTFMNPVDGAVDRMHMHHNEQLLIVALTDHWKIINARGNFFCAGEEVKSRKKILNTLPLQGQLVNRDAYPRLWAFVQTLTMWQELIDENSWWNNGLTYRGLFSTGDGVSTFRLPDERGMFDRMLDLGRGVDTSRTHNFAGGYEADQNKAHTHTTDIPSRDFDNNGNSGPDLTGPDGGANPTSKRTFTSSSNGGPEVTVKNIGKYNLIKF